MNAVTKIKIAIWLLRLAYILFFFWLIVDFFVLDRNAGLPGLLFLLIGFPLVYLENQLENLDPKYRKSLAGTVWRYLLLPWFIVM